MFDLGEQHRDGAAPLVLEVLAQRGERGMR
jgi:hypothetical protein